MKTFSGMSLFGHFRNQEASKNCTHTPHRNTHTQNYAGFHYTYKLFSISYNSHPIWYYAKKRDSNMYSFRFEMILTKKTNVKQKQQRNETTAAPAAAQQQH